MLVLVDLDDTLCNTWEAGKYTILRLIPFLLKRRKFKAFFYILTARYRELEQSRELHMMDLDKIVERLLRKIYVGISPGELDEIQELVDRVFFSNLKLFPDTVPFLEGLRGMGARIVLVTDSSTRWQRKKLEYLGIKDYFDALIISGETGHSKLDPHNFRLARQLFPHEDEVYMVGDRDDTDMRGGKEIGAVTILVSRGYFKGRLAKHADYVVKDLMEALEVIRREHEKRAEA
ncbi:HAD family hydrolase [Thermococcus thioreducens]|uniref:Hydrolase n=1 Tax=Thermococcus thioreducens TaxID=277988 RepID=A0A0Q2US92_9EURY|nr:HAD family hydrolase [Thermococcus thioreducens]ASJ11457.1 hydrolase [Thermococcus thioreducens]KQH83472.1 hydrolase [Thermococcus thioreducens]SEW06398.1 putative hydrolase of the HAD superfamily [Thermococcus thioreducens]